MRAQKLSQRTGCLLLVALLLAGCAGPAGQPSPRATSVPAAATPVPPSATPIPPSVTPVPTVTPTSTPLPTPLPSEMVYIPAGEFVMGSDEGRTDERPVHTVYLDAFYIDRTEVTNAQFAQFLNEQGNKKRGGESWLDIDDEDCLITEIGGRYQPKSGYENHPVIEVTWYGARAYCAWAGGRLPTEAEWEKAASWDTATGSKRIYPWGNEWDGSRVNADWPITATTELSTHTEPVGSRPEGASAYGVLDMAGNAWEWVADWYARDYYSDSPDQNPQGADSGEDKVMRGGSWRSPSAFARTTVRNHIFPAYTFDEGFRCARAP